MATVKFKGNEIHTNGELPTLGSTAPDFHLVDGTLADKKLMDYRGKKKLLNIVPSLDTGVCQISTKRFNELAADKNDLVVLIISADLPFAQGRFCTDEKLNNVVPLAMMRSHDFAKDYGVLIEDGPLAGVCARAVVLLDENDKVIYTELVPEITQEPNYDAAIQALN